MLSVVHPAQLVQECQQEGHRDEESEHIRNGLADLHAHKAVGAGQQENERDEEHALAAAGQEGGAPGLAHALEGHVRHNDDRLQQHGQTLVMECGQGDGRHLRVVAEQPDEDITVQPAQAHQHHQHTEGRTYRKDGRLPHPAEFAGTIVEGCYGLQALPDTDGHRDDEHEDAGDDAHAGHSCVTVIAGGDVQQHAADALQALAAKAGRAADQNHAELPGFTGDGGDAELADRFAPQEHGQQDAKADGLAEGGGDARTGGAEAEAEHEDGVQHDVQHAAGDQADHGKAGLALIAQDVVHHKAGDHQRGRDKDGPCIGAGVGQDGGRAAQQHHEAGQGRKADDGQHHADGQCRKKAGGSKTGGGLGVAAAQAAADDGAGPVAQHKAQRLENGHQAGNDAHRTGCAGGDLAHKKGVGQIVDAGDEHAQYRGSRQAQDQFRDGGLRHFAELLRAAVGICHEKTSLSL